MGLAVIPALKVAVAENLIYGLFLLPFWFATTRGGVLRLILWIERMVYATLLAIIISLAFRNGNIGDAAVCNCLLQKEMFHMEYSFPTQVQPQCNTILQTSAIWNQNETFSQCRCANSSVPGSDRCLSLVGETTFCTNTSAHSANTSASSKKIRTSPGGFRLEWLSMGITNNSWCVRNDCTAAEACCAAYFNVRIGTFLQQDAPESRAIKRLASECDEDDVSCIADQWNPPVFCDKLSDPQEGYRSALIESACSFLARGCFLEPLINCVARGDYCFSRCPMIMRIPCVLPLIAAFAWILSYLWPAVRGHQLMLGVSDEEVGLQSGIISNLLYNFLLWDFIWEFAKALVWGEVDHRGRPVIEIGQTRKDIQTSVA